MDSTRQLEVSAPGSGWRSLPPGRASRGLDLVSADVLRACHEVMAANGYPSVEAVQALCTMGQTKTRVRVVRGRLIGSGRLVLPQAPGPTLPPPVQIEKPVRKPKRMVPDGRAWTTAPIPIPPRWDAEDEPSGTGRYIGPLAHEIEHLIALARRRRRWAMYCRLPQSDPSPSEALACPS